MSRFLYRLGWACAAHRWRTLFAWIAVAAALTGLGQALGGEKKDSFSVPGTESQQAFDLLTGRFPARSGATVRVVFRGDQPLAGRASAASLTATLERLRALDDVGIVTDPLSAEGRAHLSADGRIGYSEVTYRVSPGDLDSTDVAALEKALEPARETGLTVAFGGDLSVEEPPSSEALGLGIAVVVLLVAFGSVVAMGLPLLTALIGLGVGMALVTILGAFVDVNSITPIIASMIGLAVGIDYALFVVSRHRHQLASGMGVIESIALANATAGQAVVFAGGTVVIAGRWWRSASCS